MLFLELCYSEILLAGKTLPCERPQAQNATNKRKHKTQALMGATRPASGMKAKAHKQGHN